MFRFSIQNPSRYLINHASSLVESSIHRPRGMVRVQNRALSDKTTILSQGALKNLQKELDSRVVGQPHATQAIVDALHMHAAGLGDPRLPITNLLFLGPTGVGKTELAKVLAEVIYGSREALLQFDMSKYKHQANVSELVGTTAGYIGYENGGILTEAVRQKPQRIILLDEIEKAHREVLHVFLSIWGSGEIRDNRGRVVLFNQSIFIATSNLYSLKMRELFSQNFSTEQVEETLRDSFMESLSPELYGRVTPIIFNPACNTQLKLVIDKMLKDVKHRVETKTGIYLNIYPSINEYIEREGCSLELGFRPTARFIEQKIVLPIARLINEKQIGQIVDIKYYNGKVCIVPLEKSEIFSNSNQIQVIKNLIAQNNLDEAIRLYEKLSSESFANMSLWPKEFVALSLQIGEKCMKNKTPQARRIFTDLAARGNVEAKAYLGNIYFQEKNYKEALPLFMSASEFDNPIANFYLGKMYIDHLGVDYNPNLAEKFFDKVEASESADLINLVGVIYNDKKHILFNRNKGMKCYEKSAQLGNSWAHYNMGTHFLNNSQEKNEPEKREYLLKAINCFIKAGELGAAKKDSYTQLAKIYREGLSGCPKDEELAKKYEDMAK